MHYWNVVVTIQQGRFQQAIEFIEEFGLVGKTDYFNVLVMRVEEIQNFLDQLEGDARTPFVLGNVIGRIMPVYETFDFQQPDVFETELMKKAESWLAQLAGASFHVRMHRRGFKERLSSQDEERFLDTFILKRLGEQGATASIELDDPDYIIDVETVGQRAGLSLWSREQRQRYPFLKLD